MKNKAICLIFFLILVSCRKDDKIPRGPLNPVPFTAVHLNDAFWAPKIQVNRTVSIPLAFQKCEETGRIDNFALAGGLISGEHKGDFPFDDTDVYKVIEGASYSLAYQYDPKLDHYLDSIIFLIGAAQEDDGYLYTCLTNKYERLRRWYGKGRWDRLNSHELYCCGHLYEAASAHYLATGKRNLLDIALKNAGLVNQVFGPGTNQKKVPSGHPIIEMALVKLYRITKDEKYLKLARFFIQETGRGTDGHRLSPYSQDHKPIVNQDEAVGHAVRFGYLYSGVTDVASLMHDQALADASRRVWKNVVSEKLYITGGIGSRAQGEGFGPGYELPNMTAYCESCASIANIYWNYRMFLNEGNSKYYDVLERVLYNGVISGVSMSGDKFFYDNPLESVHNHERAPWFGCACCPGNIVRFMASVPGYLYTTGRRDIYVNLYAGGVAFIPFGKDTAVIRQQTRYPWDGKVVLIIDKPGKEHFNLKIRIPGWSRNQTVPSDLYRFTEQNNQVYSISLNGTGSNPPVIKGYATLKHRWKSGDRIEIDFPMPVRKIQANSQVTNDAGKLAIQRGPLVYCFEDKDNHGGWMFDTFIPAGTAIKDTFEQNLLGGVVTLAAQGINVTRFDQSIRTQPVYLKAIPCFAWNNRGPANIVVWMPAEEKYCLLKPEPSPADSANVTASTGWASGVNDGFDPASSSDIDKSYFYWWLKEGSEENIDYTFKEPVTLSASSVYWLHLDHYDVTYRVPDSWQLLFLNTANRWCPVVTTGNYGLTTGCYNSVTFQPVRTKALRIKARLQENHSAGILEWKIR